MRGIDGHLHPGRDTRDGVAHAGNDARRLMARDKGLADDEGAHASMQEIVQIRPADAAAPRRSSTSCGASGAGLVGLQAQIARPVDAAGQAHGASPYGMSSIGKIIRPFIVVSPGAGSRCPLPCRVRCHVAAAASSGASPWTRACAAPAPWHRPATNAR